MAWHDYLALAFCAAAAAFVAARAYRALFSSGKFGCGSGCGSCGSKVAAGGPNGRLMAIEPSSADMPRE